MHSSVYLIIGVGNTLRRDDGAGIWLAKAVAAALAERGSVVEIRLLQQLLPEIAEEIGEVLAQTVLIADCRAEGPAEAEGWVRRLATAEEAATPIGSHGLGAAGLYRLRHGWRRCPG
jgi:hydrogenase maturation protease